MTTINGIVADQLRSFVERIECLDDEIAARQQEQMASLRALSCTHEGYCGKDGRRLPNPFDRFLSKIEMTPDGCWLWQGTTSPNGYGMFGFGGTNVLAHRWAYEAVRGAIPENLVCDHLCRNRACVNPFHIEPVSTRENVARGISMEVTVARQRAKTHCPHGHPYSGANLYVFGNGFRACRECARNRRRAYEAKRASK